MPKLRDDARSVFTREYARRKRLEAKIAADENLIAHLQDDPRYRAEVRNAKQRIRRNTNTLKTL